VIVVRAVADDRCDAPACIRPCADRSDFYRTARIRVASRVKKDQFIDERLIARLTSLFGLLALLLAAIGLYGVTAHTVVRRTPEIGIRMALGAARTRVIGAVVRGALLQAILGLAIGIPIAMFCVRYVKSQLYEITSVSVPVMAIAIVVLVSAAAIAGLIPALRAASIDPVRALRAG
jgi:macrolide transport system ATP-binding/permease protein